MMTARPWEAPIAELRTQYIGLNARFDELRARFDDLRSEVKYDIDALRTEIKRDLVGMRTELKTEFGDRFGQFQKVMFWIWTPIATAVFAIAIDVIFRSKP